MSTVEGYLSRVAAQVWPGAVVYREPDDHAQDRNVYTLERPGLDPIGLGRDEGFSGARQALRALARAHTEAPHGATIKQP